MAPFGNQPDRNPRGPLEDEGPILEDQTSDPPEIGQFYFRTDINAPDGDPGVFRLRWGPGAGEVRTIPGGLPPATMVGQVLFSEDGATVTVEDPLVGCDGWLANDDEELLVCG